MNICNVNYIHIYTLNIYQFSVHTYYYSSMYIVYIFIQDLYHGARAQIRT